MPLTRSLPSWMISCIPLDFSVLGSWPRLAKIPSIARLPSRDFQMPGQGFAQR
jgi:hypothetical protein